MTDQIIILGWDALDAELASTYGLDERFGSHMQKIETVNNPIVGKPHTKEVWPSLISGASRAKHGISAVDGSDGAEWDNPILSAAAPLARTVLPQSTVSSLGASLRDRGYTPDQHGPEYYKQHGIETVFDDVGGRPVSIPNYRTDRDERHGLDANRDSVWSELDLDRTDKDLAQPTVDEATVYDVLGRAMGKRVGQTMQAVQAGEPLVWTWFGVLDSAGHMDPAVDSALQRDWYHAAAAATETITQLAPDSATVVVLSDHGLQDGVHTEYATLCTNSSATAENINSIFDVAPWIRRQSPSGISTGSSRTTSPETVTNRLEALGYV